MNFAGIDLGTTYTKTHTGLTFASGVSDKYTDMANNVLTVHNRNYAMGLFNKKSDYGINLNKTLNPNVRLNYLYALWQLTSGDIGHFKSVVVGLPAGQWKAGLVTNDFKTLLSIKEPITVRVNGKDKIIQVDNVGIVPEGAGAYYAIDYSKFKCAKTLLLDWGGLTLNSCLFQNDELVDVDTNEDFAKYIEEGKSIFIMIPQSLFPSQMVRDILTTFYISRIWLTVQMREDNADARLCNVVFDEVHQVPTTARFLSNHITEFRRHRLGLILSCHYLKQFRSLLTALKSCGASYVLIAGTEKENLEMLKEDISPFTVEEGMNLEQWHALNIINYGNQHAKFICHLPKK